MPGSRGLSLNGVPSEQPQLLHLLAEAAQTSQRLVFLSGDLELLKLEDLQGDQNGAAATRVYRRDRLEQPVQGDFLGAQARFDKLEAYLGRRSLDHCAWPALNCVIPECHKAWASRHRFCTSGSTLTLGAR